MPCFFFMPLCLSFFHCFFSKHHAIIHQKVIFLDVPNAPEGDKYKVAQRWGHIHIVNRKWFDQSVARRGNALCFHSSKFWHSSML